jgi:hypothetical protein
LEDELLQVVGSVSISVSPSKVKVYTSVPLPSALKVIVTSTEAVIVSPSISSKNDWVPLQVPIRGSVELFPLSSSFDQAKAKNRVVSSSNFLIF